MGNTLNFFGISLNGLEFVTYVVIPAAIFLVVVVYLYFNLKILLLASELNADILSTLDKEDYYGRREKEEY